MITHSPVEGVVPSQMEHTVPIEELNQFFVNIILTRRIALQRAQEHEEWSRVCATHFRDGAFRAWGLEKQHSTVARCYRQAADQLARAGTVQDVKIQIAILHRLERIDYVERVQQIT
jgi:hypothetical protein